MTWHKPLLIGAACLTASACNRDDGAAGQTVAASRQAQAPAPTQAEQKPAPRSIMRPAVVTPEPAPLPPPPALVTIPFATPGHGLDEAQMAALDDVARRLTETGGHAIVRGSTDSHGSDRRNRVVSRRRAALVAAYLEKKGVAHDRLTIVALGEDRPIAPNALPDGSDDPQGRGRNRRVEIEMIANEAVPQPAEQNEALSKK